MEGKFLSYFKVLCLCILTLVLIKLYKETARGRMHITKVQLALFFQETLQIIKNIEGDGNLELNMSSWY